MEILGAGRCSNLAEYADLPPGFIVSPKYTEDWVKENILKMQIASVAVFDNVVSDSALLLGLFCGLLEGLDNAILAKT
jgi:hypothetical protein